jgi:DNA-binding transcriptional MerR regulator
MIEKMERSGVLHMEYSIKTMSQKVGLTEYTLRYYEKEGLLPLIKRDENGNRIFNDQDLEWITLICCLRETGMPIADIKRYVVLCKGGAATVGARKQILIDHKIAVEQKIRQYKKYANRIDEKISCYDNVENNNGTDHCNPYSMKEMGYELQR